MTPVLNIWTKDWYIVDKLKEQGIYDDMAIIITSDHGENMGELGIYRHATADQGTTRIPMIIKWPGMKTGTNKGLHVNVDLLPTIADIIGEEKTPHWDGVSYKDALSENKIVQEST